MIDIRLLKSINQSICKDNDQVSVVINENNLLSALSVQQWYEDDLHRAAALIRSITIGHGFQDGNKRTAACVGMYIHDYGCSEDEMIECILDIATGKLKDVDEITTLLYPVSSYK